ncbi:hypothetical protein [Borrelia hispanica]|uniref:hypothetical protein n=1 Tax=Borrelia hispanica TaxID=40835 RepID=UPI0004665663|nr:hypothetical protein [Borrelia hispanica]
MREVKFNLYLFAIITISCKSGDYVDGQEDKKIDLSSKKIVTPAKKVIIPPVIPPSALTVTKTETSESNPSVQEHNALESKNKAYIRLKKSISQYKEQFKTAFNQTVKNTESMEILIESLSGYEKAEEYNYIYTTLEKDTNDIDNFKKVLEELFNISWSPTRYNNEANITYYDKDEKIPKARYNHHYEKMMVQALTKMKQTQTQKYASLLLDLINVLFKITSFINDLLYKCLHDSNLARFKSAEKLNQIYDQLDDIMNKRKDAILKVKKQISLAAKHIDEVKMVDEIKKIVESGGEAYSAYKAMDKALDKIWELKYNVRCNYESTFCWNVGI